MALADGLAGPLLDDVIRRLRAAFAVLSVHRAPPFLTYINSQRPRREGVSRDPGRVIARACLSRGLRRAASFWPPSGLLTGPGWLTRRRTPMLRGMPDGVTKTRARAAGAALWAPALDRKSALPLSRQLAAAFRAAIAEGRLGAWARLPSTRALAAELGLARSTVVAVFEQL